MKNLIQAIRNAIGVVVLRWALSLMSDDLIYRLGIDIIEAIESQRTTKQR